MSSAAQISANRLNAAKSSGPRSSEVSSLNSRKHGLRADSTALLPSESRAQWDALLSDLHEEWSPQTPTENLWVEKMAAAEWKRRRSEIFEAEGLKYEGATSEDGFGMAYVRDANKAQTIGVVIRYRRAAETAFATAMHELERAQARRNLPSGATLPPPMALDVTVTGIEPSDSDE